MTKHYFFGLVWFIYALIASNDGKYLGLIKLYDINHLLVFWTLKVLPFGAVTVTAAKLISRVV